MTLFNWILVILIVISPFIHGMMNILSICIYEIVIFTCFLLFYLTILSQNKIQFKISKTDLFILLIFLLGTISLIKSIYPDGTKKELAFILCCISFFLCSNIFFIPENISSFL